MNKHVFVHALSPEEMPSCRATASSPPSRRRRPVAERPRRAGGGDGPSLESPDSQAGQSDGHLRAPTCMPWADVLNVTHACYLLECFICRPYLFVL
jgi:hypothetical protein